MIQTTIQAHPLLYHYTTAAGLKGIIESQQIHATSIAYLNDAEEHTGFFDRRLPILIEQPIGEAVRKEMQSPSRRSVTDEVGESERTEAKLRSEFIDNVREVTLAFNDPYIASFSAPPKHDIDDGLLSQWRAYGYDGGYAIIFESAGLEILLKTEAAKFYYQFGTWGDVDYYDQDTPHQARHPETLNYQALVQRATSVFLQSGKETDLEPLLEPLTLLSVLHKHRGFREEEEVRIVMLRPHSEVERLAREQGDMRPLRPIQFRQKRGMLIPYIELFGEELGANAKLPIKRVIVGPHPDQKKRRTTVENLLRKNNVDAEVTVSSIPYLGT